MEIYLILAAIICILCIFASNLSYRIGVPSLLLFIILGMLFGTDGIFRISFSDFQLSEKVCSVALIFIMFYGGFCTNWKEAKPVAVKAVLLSTIGVLATAVLTGLFCYFVLKTSLLEGMLIGAVLSSTDAASVFSILRMKKLSLVNRMGSLLEVESGSNDPMAYLLTTIVLSIMAGSSDSSITTVFLTQIVFGVLFGALFGFLSARILRVLDFRARELTPIFISAAALLTYGITSSLMGNGFLSVYIAGMILGNSKIQYKVELVHFFDGITGMMQITLFFLLGLLSFPSQIIPVILPSVLIMAFMLFIARPAAVWLLLFPFRTPLSQLLLISWAGLRGAASIVFAILAVISPAVYDLDIFHIVFCVCLLSVAVQGSLLPWMARKLDVISSTENIFKTFNDYQEDQTIHLTELKLPDGHPWIGRQLKDILFPQGALAVLIKRKGGTLIPCGDTTILPDDIIILNSPAFTDESGLKLKEVEIGQYHPWVNQPVKSIKIPSDTLVILIKRDLGPLIPDGDTIIKNGDVLILNA